MRSKAFNKKIRRTARRISPLGLGKAYAQAHGELNARSTPGVSVRRPEAILAVILPITADVLCVRF